MEHNLEKFNNNEWNKVAGKLELDLVKLTTHIEYIKKSQENNSSEHKEMIKKIDQFVNKVEEDYATKKELYTAHEEHKLFATKEELKTAQQEHNRLDKTVMWALRTSVMNLLGFLVAVIWFLINKVWK